MQNLILMENKKLKAQIKQIRGDFSKQAMTQASSIRGLESIAKVQNKEINSLK